MAFIVVMTMLPMVFAQPAQAAANTLKGNINASSLKSGIDYYLEDDTTITLKDGDNVSVQSIGLNEHALTIQGSDGGTLKVLEGISSFDETAELNVNGGHLICQNLPAFEDAYVYGVFLSHGYVGVNGGILEAKCTENEKDSYGVIGVYVATLEVTGGIFKANVTSNYRSASCISAGGMTVTGGLIEAKAVCNGSGTAYGIHTPSNEDADLEMTGGIIRATGLSAEGEGYGMYWAGQDETNHADFTGGSVTLFGTTDGFLSWVPVTIAGTVDFETEGETGNGIGVDSNGPLKFDGQANFRAETHDDFRGAVDTAHLRIERESGLQITTPVEAEFDPDSKTIYDLTENEENKKAAIVEIHLSDFSLDLSPDQVWKGESSEVSASTYNGLDGINLTIRNQTSNQTVLDKNTGTITVGADETADRIIVRATKRTAQGQQVSERFIRVKSKKSLDDAVISKIGNTTWTGAPISKRPSKVTYLGKTLVYGEDYSCTYEKNKNVGTAVTNIIGMGEYTGERAVKYSICPEGTTLKAVTAKTNTVVLKWKKQAKKMSASRITGYEIQYSNTKNFKTSKTVRVKGYANTQKAIKVTRANQKLLKYFRIRTYKIIDNTTYCSSWSGVKTFAKKRK